MKIETEIAIKKICDLDLGWRMNWERVWKALDILRGRGDGTDKNTSTVDDPPGACAVRGTSSCHV